MEIGNKIALRGQATVIGQNIKTCNFKLTKKVIGEKAHSQSINGSERLNIS